MKGRSTPGREGADAREARARLEAELASAFLDDPPVTGADLDAAERAAAAAAPVGAGPAPASPSAPVAPPGPALRGATARKRDVSRETPPVPAAARKARVSRETPAARVVAIVNQKGGVGKTTTAVNLAASLAAAEKRTLLVDLDPQGNATSGLGVSKEGLEGSVYDVLVGGAPLADVIVPGGLDHLDLAPATVDLFGAEIELVPEVARERRLAEALEPVRGKYQFILVDCPPSLGLLTVNALTAVDSVLIPIQCEYYALEGLSQLLGTIRIVQKSLNPDLEIEGVLLTMYDARLNLARQVQEEAVEYFGEKVYDTVIPRNVRLSEAPSFGKPALLYDILSPGATSYMRLAEEVIDRCRPANG